MSPQSVKNAQAFMPGSPGCTFSMQPLLPFLRNAHALGGPNYFPPQKRICTSFAYNSTIAARGLSLDGIAGDSDDVPIAR
jgi:hypothetical protein